MADAAEEAGVGMSGLSAPRERDAMGRQRSEPVARTPVRDSASATGSDQNQWGVVLLEKWREEPWPTIKETGNLGRRDM